MTASSFTQLAPRSASDRTHGCRVPPPQSHARQRTPIPRVMAAPDADGVRGDCRWSAGGAQAGCRRSAGGVHAKRRIQRVLHPGDQVDKLLLLPRAEGRGPSGAPQRPASACAVSSGVWARSSGRLGAAAPQAALSTDATVSSRHHAAPARTPSVGRLESSGAAGMTRFGEAIRKTRAVQGRGSKVGGHGTGAQAQGGEEVVKKKVEGDGERWCGGGWSGGGVWHLAAELAQRCGRSRVLTKAHGGEAR